MVTLYRFIQNVRLVDSLSHFRLEETVNTILEAGCLKSPLNNISNQKIFDNNLGTLFMLNTDPIL